MIVFNNPFITEGNWYKGNLHTHTNISDGHFTCEQVIETYCKNKYDFLAITDHWWKITDNYLEKIKELTVKYNNILIIPGEEIDCGITKLGIINGNIGYNFHLVCLNIKNVILNENRKHNEFNPQDIINSVKSQDGEIILAHPYWSGLTLEDMLSIHGYIGVEIFNTDTHLTVNKGFSLSHWDDLLNTNRKILGFSSDDSHATTNDFRPIDLCGAWIMVKSKFLTINSIMKSILNGLFYSSTGPEIKKLEINNKKIYIETSPVKYISFISQNGSGMKLTAKKDNFLKYAEFKIEDNLKYLRIECKDESGNYAWTNPIFKL